MSFASNISSFDRRLSFSSWVRVHRLPFSILYMPRDDISYILPRTLIGLNLLFIVRMRSRMWAGLLSQRQIWFVILLLKLYMMYKIKAIIGAGGIGEGSEGVNKCDFYDSKASICVPIWMSVTLCYTCFMALTSSNETKKAEIWNNPLKREIWRMLYLSLPKTNVTQWYYLNSFPTQRWLIRWGRNSIYNLNVKHIKRHISVNVIEFRKKKTV